MDCCLRLARRLADRFPPEIDAAIGVPARLVTDGGRKRPNDALRQGLHLEKHERAGDAQHDKGSEVA
jgi:hypothetical protein